MNPSSAVSEPDRIAALKAGLRTTYSGAWPAVQKRADETAASHPPVYETHDAGGDALWWQMDVAAKLPVLALSYVVTGQKNYFEAADEWTLASCNYRHWGAATRDGGDLAAGFMLTAVAVTYDFFVMAATRDTAICTTKTIIRHASCSTGRKIRTNGATLLTSQDSRASARTRSERECPSAF